jgi:hypothetical protein
VDPDWESGSRIRIQGQENEEKISTGTSLVVFIFITEMYKNSSNFFVDFLILEKICLLKYCCGSGSVSGLDPDSMTLWIRIRIESIRFHNPALFY